MCVSVWNKVNIYVLSKFLVSFMKLSGNPLMTPTAQSFVIQGQLYMVSLRAWLKWNSNLNSCLKFFVKMKNYRVIQSYHTTFDKANCALDRHARRKIPGNFIFVDLKYASWWSRILHINVLYYQNTLLGDLRKIKSYLCIFSKNWSYNRISWLSLL